MDNRWPDHNIYFGNDVKRALPDPRLETAKTEMHQFYKPTFWALGQGMLMCMSGSVFSKERNINVDQMFFFSGAGGIGMSQ